MSHESLHQAGLTDVSVSFLLLRQSAWKDRLRWRKVHFLLLFPQVSGHEDGEDIVNNFSLCLGGPGCRERNMLWDSGFLFAPLSFHLCPQPVYGVSTWGWAIIPQPILGKCPWSHPYAYVVISWMIPNPVTLTTKITSHERPSILGHYQFIQNPHVMD